MSSLFTPGRATLARPSPLPPSSFNRHTDPRPTSVIQRQLYLMRQRRPLDPSLPSSPSVPLHTVQEAYDIARKEFYELRLEEDIERRIAKEEALHVGAYFGPTHLEVGMQLENQAYEDWRAWANREYELKAHSRAAQYTGEGSEEGDAGELVPVEE